MISQSEQRIEKDAWPMVVRAMYNAMRIMYDLGYFDPETVVFQCEKYLQHEKGCPEEAVPLWAALKIEALMDMACDNGIVLSA
jgi:hypothetical protein